MNGESRRSAIARALTILIALLTCVRALLAFDPMPGWGLDPYTIAAPAGAFGPREAAMLDVLTLLLSGVVLLLLPPARWKRWTVWAVLLLVMATVGLVHGLPDGPRPADLSPALAWLAAVAGAGAIVCGAAHEGTRRTILALLVGFTAMLIAKGLVQLLVEHPTTLAQFEANRAQMLAAQGLQEGSAGARAFERRLRQPEITGWIGFSNVVASFLAAAGVALAALALSGRRMVTVCAGVGALVSLGLVVYGGSKGAVVAGALGLSVVALGRFAPVAWHEGGSRSRIAGLLAVAVLLGPLLALVLRGMIGERVGELSLLFRWFYVEAAGRIAIGNPLLGVGPGGFKDAYAMAKNPISPENAASPHSVLFDAAATMGLVVGFGVAVLLAFACYRSARAVHGSRNVVVASTSLQDMPPFPRLALLAGPALAVAVAARFEIVSVGGLTPSLAMAWIGGLAGWATLAWVAWNASVRPACLAAAAAALVLVAHGQIEMTPVLMGSSALFAAWLGLGLAGDDCPEAPTQARHAVGRFIGVLPVLLALLVAMLAVPSLWRWQGSVLHAADRAQQPATHRAALEASGGDPRVVRAVAEEVSQAIGRRVGPSSLGDGLRALAAQTARQAAESMDRAVAAAPADGPTLRAASRAWLVVGMAGDEAAQERALELATRATETKPDSGQNFSYLATVLAALDREGTAAESILEALKRAEALNPASPLLKYRQHEIARRAGLVDRARRSAEAALRADENMRLDRLGAGLDDRQRVQLELYLEGS